MTFDSTFEISQRKYDSSKKKLNIPSQRHIVEKSRQKNMEELIERDGYAMKVKGTPKGYTLINSNRMLKTKESL